MKPEQTMLLFFILLFFHCDLTDAPEGGSLSLTLEDVSCTEAWLTLKTTDLPLPTSVTLMQNDLARTTINLSTADTLLYLDSLLPKQTYTFQVSSNQSASGGPVSSNKATAATLDTTCHNFTWQTFTFGQHSNSVLYDVAIINENNIWAVGEIYMNDSLGQPDPNGYNAVHWDGQSWELKRIGNQGGWVRYTVFAFSATDVWFEGVIRWDGVNYTVHNNGFPLEPNGDGWQINKMWGSLSNDLYAVGNGGNIANYNGSSWTKIESGTTTIINDIWGIVDENNETIAYCPVSSFWTPGDKKILRIKGNSVDSIPWGFDKLIYSVWASNNLAMYACGYGIFYRKNNEWKEINITSVASNRVRGNGLNDIFVAGDFGFIAHFNGATWNIEEYDYNSGYGGLSVLGSVIAVTGQRNGKALIKVGKRN